MPARAVLPSVLLAASVVLGVGVGPASAAWGARSTPGPAAASALVVTQPAGLTARPFTTGVGLVTSNVELTWQAVTLASRPASGYAVSFRVVSGLSVTRSGTCTVASVPTTTCTDSFGVNVGSTVEYSVRAVFGSWVGPPSVVTTTLA